MIVRAVMRRKVIVTTVKTMMTNRRVSKLDPAEELGHDWCFITSSEKSPGLSRVKLCSSCTFLDRFISIDLFQRRQSRVTRWSPRGCISDVWEMQIPNSTNRPAKKQNSCKLTRSYAYDILKFEGSSNDVSFSQTNGQERLLRWKTFIPFWLKKEANI